MYNLNKIPQYKKVANWKALESRILNQIIHLMAYEKILESELLENYTPQTYYNLEADNDQFKEGILKTFRETIFSHIFSILEYGLREICISIELNNEQLFSIKDLFGNSDLIKAHIHIKKTIEENIGTYPEWNFIKECQRVRNAIVHNYAEYQKNSDLESFLKKNSTFKIDSKTCSFIMINNVINRKLIDHVFELFRRLFRKIIYFNEGVVTEQC